MRVNDKNLAISAAPSHYVSQMFSSFFKFGHYMGLVPFRTSLTRMSEKSAENRKTPLNVYTVLVYIVTTVILLFCFLQTYWGTGRFGWRNETTKFADAVYMAAYIIWIVYITAVRVTLVRNRANFQQLVDSFYSFETQIVFSNGKLRKIVSIAPYLFTLYFILETSVDMMFIVMRVHEYGFSGAVDEYLRSTRRMRDSMQGYPFHTNITIDLWDVVGGGCLFLGNAYTNLLSYYIDKVCLLVAFAFYVTIQDQAQTRQTKAEIRRLHAYHQLQKLTDAVDKAVGTFIFLKCFGWLLFYSFKIQEAFGGDTCAAMEMPLYLLTIVVFLLVSAQANTMANREFLQFSPKGLRNFKVKHLAGDQPGARRVEATIVVSSPEIGLKGRVFIINYKLVGQLVSLVVTYAVVIVQFQQQQSRSRLS